MRELFVGGYLWLGGRDTDMGFVDTGALGLCRSLVLPDILLRWVPEASVVDGRHAELLGYAGNPGWEALLTGAIVGDDEGDLQPVC